MHLPTSHFAARAEPAPLSLAPLDVPLIIEVGRALDATAVAEACRGWKGVPTRRLPRVSMRLDGAPGLAGTGVVRMITSGSAMVIEGPGVQARAEPDLGRAICRVSPSYMADPERLREEVLEPLMLMLVTAQDRTPLHASAFIVNDLAIVLAGRSGAGKSCLARAADEAGHQLLTDDVVYVQRSPRLRVWGWPRAAHLLPPDAPGEDWPIRIRNAKTKYAIPLRSASATARACERAVLCVLARGETPALTPIDAQEARRRLWPLDPGFDLLPHAIGASIETLAARGAWELRLSRNPDEALRLLLASLPELSRTAAG